MQFERETIHNSYWVIPSRFRAGEYPGGRDEGETQARLRWLLDQDIDLFMDLTQGAEEGLQPYEDQLINEASNINKTIWYRRIPIEDFSTPSSKQMGNVLAEIELALEAGRNIYLHCLGGKGRTGTVIGCYLAEHGYPGEKALKKIEELRKGFPNASNPSPETDEQRKLVKEWNKKKK